LGADLHVWSMGLCAAMDSEVRIRTAWDWSWMDQQSCGPLSGTNNATKIGSPFQCYFPHAELQCPNDTRVVQDHPNFDNALLKLSGRGGRSPGELTWDCRSTLSGIEGADNFTSTSKILPTTKILFQTATMNYLFGQVSTHLVAEAERQHQLVFGKNASVGGDKSHTPDDLITVHVRWGDKKNEMKLVPIQQYVDAIHRLLQERPRPKVNIFLATEDPEAVKQFQESAPSEWIIYLDPFYEELLPHRGEGYNNVPRAGKELKGKLGTTSLGSLLVAMEANEFVLTTESNWSRLMDAVRATIVDPSCDGCTKVVDLRPFNPKHVG